MLCKHGHYLLLLWFHFTYWSLKIASLMVPISEMLDTAFPVVFISAGSPPKNNPPAVPGALTTFDPSGIDENECKMSSIRSSSFFPTFVTIIEWYLPSPNSKPSLASLTSPRPAFIRMSTWPRLRLTE